MIDQAAGSEFEVWRTMNSQGGASQFGTIAQPALDLGSAESTIVAIAQVDLRPRGKVCRANN